MSKSKTTQRNKKEIKKMPKATKASARKKSSGSNKLLSGFSKRTRVLVFVVAFAAIGSVIAYSFAQPKGPANRPTGNIIAGVSGTGPVSALRENGTVSIKAPASYQLADNGKLYCTLENSPTTISKTVSSEKLDLVKSLVKQQLTDNGAVENSKGAVISATTIVENKNGKLIHKSYATVSGASEKDLTSELNSLCNGAGGDVVPGDKVPEFEDQSTLGVTTSFNSKLNSLVFHPAAATATVEDTNAENYIVSTVNAFRNYVGLQSLANVGCMHNADSAWSKWMASNLNFNHSTIFYNQIPYYTIVPIYCGTNWQSIGENIVVGPASSSSGKIAVNAWAHSPEHLANMTNSAFNKTGVGVWNSSDGRFWATQGFWQDMPK